jgi:hypothetical protein
VLGVGCEADGDGLQIACDLGPEELVDELVQPCARDDVFTTPAGSLTVTPALVDEGAEAGGEPVGFGEVDVVATVGPLVNEHVGDADLVEAGLVFRRFALEHPSLFSIGIQRTLPSSELWPQFRAAASDALVLSRRLIHLQESDLLAQRTVRDATFQFHRLCEGLAAVELRETFPPGKPNASGARRSRRL